MKQHLIAIRMLCDWVVVTQVLPVNPRGGGPGAEARRHQGRAAGPLASGGELIERIDTGTLAGLRDRALLLVLPYSFARVSAVLGMRRQDSFRQAAPVLAQAPREGREAARRPGSPPDRLGPRRQRRGGRARRSRRRRSSRAWIRRAAGCRAGRSNGAWSWR